MYIGRLESGYGIRILPSTSGWAPQCSLRPRRASKKPRPVQFLGEPYSGSKDIGIYGCLSIHGLPGRHASSGWERW
jgi:hypothetical protein